MVSRTFEWGKVFSFHRCGAGTRTAVYECNDIAEDRVDMVLASHYKGLDAENIELATQIHTKSDRIRALEAELADCKSDLAAAEKQGDAAHEACVEYEERIRALEAQVAEMQRYVDDQRAEIQGWRNNCTGRHGSQTPCFESEPPATPTCPPCQLELGGPRCDACGYAAETPAKLQQWRCPCGEYNNRDTCVQCGHPNYAANRD